MSLWGCSNCNAVFGPQGMAGCPRCGGTTSRVVATIPAEPPTPSVRMTVPPLLEPRAERFRLPKIPLEQANVDKPLIIGCDFARPGSDKTVISHRDPDTGQIVVREVGET